MIKGEKVFLRAVEPADLDKLYVWENDPEVWSVSVTSTLYSKYLLKEYIDNAGRSIYEVGQQRFMICRLNDGEAIGTADLFDFDPHNRRAGVGILIYDKSDRGKGYANEALKLLEWYAKESLNMNQLYCNVVDNNEASKTLFPKMDYVMCARKKQWLMIGGEWFDELTYQKLL